MALQQGKSIATTDDQEELFIVVDKYDNIIDFRTRYDCHHDKSLIHRASGILIYDHLGNVLLQKRSLTKDLQPGLWSISAAGHVTKGESYEQAAERELQEELGVALPLKKVDVRYVDDGHEQEMEALFEARYEGPFKPNSTEIDHVEFFSKDELREKMKTGEVKLSTWADQTLKHVRFM